MCPGTGSKPTAESPIPDSPLRPRFSARARIILGFLGAALALGLLAAVIVPRADEVGDALGRVGIGRFALVVLLGACALVFRTTAWQVAIDAAGGRVRAPEAHSASAASYLVAMVSTYLGVVTRIALIRHRVPDRSPTTSQQVAAESALVVVEGAIVGFLLLCCSWTLGIPFVEALAIFIAGVAAVIVLVIAARRLAPRRFGAGLAVARQPHSLALVATATSGTVLAQIARVAVALGSVGLDTSPLIVVAVFLASGVGAVIPIGTAASGAAAPLIAASAEGGSVADATAAGVLLSGGLLVSCLGYLVAAATAAAVLDRSARMRPGERG
jgi:uncharacterized membrane protein YbhN (UPF0104 family)